MVMECLSIHLNHLSCLQCFVEFSQCKFCTSYIKSILKYFPSDAIVNGMVFLYFIFRLLITSVQKNNFCMLTLYPATLPHSLFFQWIPEHFLDTKSCHLQRDCFCLFLSSLYLSHQIFSADFFPARTSSTMLN